MLKIYLITLNIYKWEMIYKKDWNELKYFNRFEFFMDKNDFYNIYLFINLK